jgi:hypothetical protein
MLSVHLNRQYQEGAEMKRVMSMKISLSVQLTVKNGRASVS